MFTGIVEGFYGKPYSPSQRNILLDYTSELDSPCYIYAPKNDRYHRLDWRVPYPDPIWSQLRASISHGRDRGVRFVFAVSPWRFAPGEDHILRRKVCRAIDAGAGAVAVLFDDIPDSPSPDLASMQLEFAERALEGTGCDVLVCPSIYCIELMERHSAHAYVDIWKRACPEGWEILWTGDEVISPEMDQGSVATACDLLGREPAIWDNLLADDYCLRRVFLAGLGERTGTGRYSYFLNPSSIFPVALHGAMELAAAEGKGRRWPAALGPRLPGWELLSEFHYLPWTTGETGAELLCRIEDGFTGKGEADVLEWLSGSMESLTDLSASLECIEGGLDLMPLVLDLHRFFSILARTIRDSRPGSRRELLTYLLQERLPYEHPVAALARRLIGLGQDSER